jgi:hypothetical protein
VESGVAIAYAVEDGVSYDFKIRYETAAGLASDWLLVEDYEVIGKTTPPPDVTGLAYSNDNEGTWLVWDQVVIPDFWQYEVRVGGTEWADATFYARIDATEINLGLLLSGTHTYRIKALDVIKLESVTDATVSVVVNNPGIPLNFSAQGIGSKVVMNWGEPASSYPIKEYRIWKRRTAGGISQMIPIAKVSASYFVNEEFAAGSYSFGVSAVDMAGNESAINELEDDIIVLAPMGFTSYLENTVYFDETGWDGVTIDVDSGIPNAYSLLFTPADIGQPELPDPSYRYIVAGIRRTDKSFAERMTELGLTNFQDAVDAGYGKYMEPMYETLQQTFLMTPVPGDWIDLGFVTKMAAVSVSLNYREFGGELATSEIIRSEVFKGYYGATVPQIFQTADFYAGDWQRVFSKLRITPKPNTIRIIESLTIKISLALIDYSGVDAADENDALGTFITFPDSYNYVVSLTATPQGNTDIHIVVAEEAATPITGFYVFAFDSAGDRVTANFYWTVKGY